MECQVGVKCGCLCVESGILRSTNRVQLAKSKNDFQRKGTLDSDSAHREQHFKPIKPKCNPHGRRETTFGGILARVTIRVAHIRM